MIYTLTGPSGVGKSTIAKKLIESCGAERLLSYSTRERRASDAEGELVFISDEKFDQLSKTGKFMWEVCPHGSARYGMLKEDIHRCLNDDTRIYVAILTIEAVATLQEYAKNFGKPSGVVSVYLHVKAGDEEILRLRLENRGDSKDEIENRIRTCGDWNALAERSEATFLRVNAVEDREHVARSVLEAFSNRAL